MRHLIPLVLCLAALPPAPATDLEALVAELVPSYVQILGGSGVVISADGLMLSNHHVIAAAYQQGRRRFPVRLGDRILRADVLGTDPRGDLALLRIDLAEGESLPFVPLADSDELTVGQRVIAIGNPFAAMGRSGDPTVTFGVISLLHRNNGSYSDAIMSDVPTNPGNSGGPLLTYDGTLAGINGQIASKTGARANTGIGMAIPANQIARFLPELKAADGGRVLHGHLRGLRFDTEEDDGIYNGAEIASVDADTHVAAAGLRAGDRIVAVDDVEVHNGVRLRGVIGTYPASASVAITYVRDGATVTVPVPLEPLERGHLGLELARPDDRAELRALLRRLQRDPDAEVPVIIAAAPAGLPAAEAGLQPGDAIVSIAGVTIRNLLWARQVQRRLLATRQFFPGDSVEIVVRRGEGDDAETITCAVTLASLAEIEAAREAQDAEDQGETKNAETEDGTQHAKGEGEGEGEGEDATQDAEAAAPEPIP